jgi:hypothetical protein
MKSRIWRLALTLCCMLLLGRAAVFAQSGRMPWVDGDFPPGSAAFEYMVSRGEGRSLKEARADAFYSFLTDCGNRAGVSVSSRTMSEIRREMYSGNGSTEYAEGEVSSTLFRINREGFRMFFAKVSECYERVRTGSGEVYRLWELYEVSSQRSFRPYIPEYTDRYGSDALLRSAIAPGWGQLHKGSRTKGIFIIAGEALLVGGLVASENLRATYIKRIGETHTAAYIKDYARKADTMENLRNVCITAAAALYIYNLIDAAASPGRKHLIIRNKELALYPVSFGGEYAGLGLALNF